MARPFDPAILKQARQLAERYRLIIESDPEGDGYIGCSVELPLVMGGGDSVQACYRDTLDATAAVIATMLESGERPPAPASVGKREQQVNIRLTADERLRIEEAARNAGFRSVSDYIRAAALAGSR